MKNLTETTVQYNGKTIVLDKNQPAYPADDGYAWTQRGTDSDGNGVRVTWLQTDTYSLSCDILRLELKIMELEQHGPEYSTEIAEIEEQIAEIRNTDGFIECDPGDAGNACDWDSPYDVEITEPADVE